MMNFLERYREGEHEGVWDELQELGEGVWEDRVFEDALAVARETMQRVRANIHILQRELPGISYQFGYAGLFIDDEDFIKEQPAQWSEVPANIQQQLEQVEKRVGPLPLALRAWYEYIGEVNFVGYAPGWQNIGCGGMEEWNRVVASQFAEDVLARFNAKYTPQSETKELEWYGLDPWQVEPLEKTIYRLEVEKTAIEQDAYGCIEISGDYHAKYNVSGSGIPYVVLTGKTMDAQMKGEWHQTTFVHYLRKCCRLAGLPGLELYKVQPEEDIAYVTRHLLPF